jgi:diguanylate cyclase (GGDEF)-like protein
VRSHLSDRRRFEDAVIAALAGAPEESVGILAGTVVGLTPIWHRDGPDIADEVVDLVVELVRSCSPEGAIVSRLGDIDFGVCAAGGGEQAVAAVRREVNRRLRQPIEIDQHAVPLIAAMACIAGPTAALHEDEVLRCAMSRAISSRVAFTQVGIDLGTVGEARSLDEIVHRIMSSGFDIFPIAASQVELGGRVWRMPHADFPDRPPDLAFELRTPFDRLGRWSTWSSRDSIIHEPWLEELFQAISFLLERALHREASEVRSRLDPLTGLLNREGLAHGMREIRPPYAVAVVDIDHFKQVNDQHGHEVGDRFLLDLGRLLSHGRSSDLVARWGGEELVMVMPGTDAEGAAVALRRLLVEAKATIVAEDTALSFSAGVSVVTDEFLGLADGIRAADAAMYEAKRDGRSRVVVAGSR